MKIMLSKHKKNIKQDVILNCYQKVFNCNEGEIVLHDLVNRSFLLQSNNYSDKDLRYIEGRRSIVLEIFNLLEFDEEKMNEIKEDNEEIKF